MLSGRELIKSHLSDAPQLPGIYKMSDINDKVIYVGKAKNLKKRLASYAKPDLIGKVARCIFQTCKLEVIITHSEAEALLLEAQQIKKLQPKFNILLKDDKSFPYIKLRLDHDYPQLIKYRGKNLTGGKFFGPFASSYQVDVTISQLQKIFKLRPCTDNYFSGRKRPCLQYEIKRCTGPCANKITKSDYAELVRQVEVFLSGKSHDLQQDLAQQMEKYSESESFERAAEVRDRIKALSYIQLKNNVSEEGIKDADVIAAAKENNHYCVQVFLYRAGQAFGNKAYFPVHTEDADMSEVLASFIGQFYQTRSAASEIIINHEIENAEVIAEAIKQLHGNKVKIVTPKRGSKLKLIEAAKLNAVHALEQHLKSFAKNHTLLKEVKELLMLSDMPERLEIYDNSHIMGAFAIGAMVVATPYGFEKKEYRLFTIKNHAGIGDDYAMLREVLQRRFLRLKKEPERRPSLMIIDGGKGHMNVVLEMMAKAEIALPFVCMSKGVDRNAGREQFHLPESTFTLERDLPVMKYLQILRDEAHRFAIKGHRHKRSNAIKVSSLDDIPGIGSKRKKALLGQFGSYKAICEASIDEIAKVDGINNALAKVINSILSQ